jgi:hypothetical protein
MLPTSFVCDFSVKIAKEISEKGKLQRQFNRVKDPDVIIFPFAASKFNHAERRAKKGFSSALTFVIYDIDDE